MLKCITKGFENSYLPGSISNTLVPSVVEKTTEGERSYDIYSRLLKDRIIFIGEQVHSGLVNTVIAQMLFLEKQDPDKDIIMYINTPGGEVYSGMAIFDTMLSVKCDIQVYCTGLAASMGSMFMAAGTPGKRFALPSSRIMIHQPLTSGGVGGQASDIDIHNTEMQKIKKMLITKMAERVGRSYGEVEKDMDRNNWMSPEDAKQYGLVDHIVKTIKKGEEISQKKGKIKRTEY